MGRDHCSYRPSFPLSVQDIRTDGDELPMNPEKLASKKSGFSRASSAPVKQLRTSPDAYESYPRASSRPWTATLLSTALVSICLVHDYLRFVFLLITSCTSLRYSVAHGTDY